MPLFADEKYLHRAARACMRRRSAPGADRVTWAQYRQGLPERLHALSRRLFDGTWQPGPLRLTSVTAYTGKTFTVAIPTAEDRVVHRALRGAVEPVLEATVLAPWVSGYRPGRNRITALRTASNHLAKGLGFVADLDVARASEGATVDQVVDWVAAHVHDGTFLDRLRTILGGLSDPMIPGSGLAPLLINLRLSRVDARLAHLPVVRFADNYCVFTATQDAAVRAFGAVTEALAAEGLRPHLTKSRVRTAANVEDLFLIAG
ncbi:reverse transcriptase domain-containing protein [Pseudofrankia sp. DC12]|uniref:reverse transcriptase domain-containing protein n=1 Tax=Pseudofrankia sp. DC12 TaxID=683315 RepID=UPI0005F7F999|nr:reverse transcriptase domain-containing protein [Pseudofrankia sp. DC12]